MIFLSEHWLSAHELPTFNNHFKDMNMWSNLKSSMDPEVVLVGRPHGGIGFVAKRLANIVYKPIVVDSDRISGVQLISDGKIILTVVGVYLPFYNSTTDQIRLYSETLDVLQSTLDNMDPSPVMIVGDMNTNLPQYQGLSRHWHRTHPFKCI